MSRIAPSALVEAERAVTKAKDQLERAMEALEKAKHPYPAEPRDGSVIQFTLRHGPNTRYKYAAIRVGYRWYTTGSTCPKNGYTWEGLWRFIEGADSHGAMFEMQFGPEVRP